MDDGRAESRRTARMLLRGSASLAAALALTGFVFWQAVSSSAAAGGLAREERITVACGWTAFMAALAALYRSPPTRDWIKARGLRSLLVQDVGLFVSLCLVWLAGGNSVDRALGFGAFVTAGVMLLEAGRRRRDRNNPRLDPQQPTTRATTTHDSG